ncbi:hypothetical protein [Nocardioides sp. 1609]|uniref:hypothetical protein n=1 Tax=Nocardioides sp. 1609 TaxID=2508327 RepID=UPI00106F3E35|nr:hypothetical protein [Nocardioides sp. 1609]
MRSLTIRWSLADAPDGVEDELAAFVAGTSHARFTGMPGLRYKVWRVRPGEWFEGFYVFTTDADRAEFQRAFVDTMAEAPGTRMIGSLPVTVEESEVVAVAEGWDGFLPAARA